MRRKRWTKRLGALGLSLAMLAGLLNPAQTEAAGEDKLVFNPDVSYAVISETTGQAIDVKAVNWGNNDTMATGEYREKNQSVNTTSLFRFGETAYSPNTVGENDTVARMYYFDAAGSYHPMRSEGNDFIFADPNNRGLDGETQASADDIKMATYIITKTGENTGTIKEANQNRYLTVNDKGEIRKSANPADAETFTFIENPAVIDDSLYIENVETGKLVTFKNQPNDEYAPIKVTGDKDNITADEKFTPSFVKNDNGIPDVVAFRSLSKPGYQIASSKWVDGAQAQIGSIGKSGGWESIAVEPAGNGQIVFRDAALGKLVTIDENECLAGGYEGDITDKERFILHTTAEITAPEDLAADDSTRTESTVDLSWTNPLSLYTDVEVYQKASNEETFTKVKTLTNENAYQAKSLKPGMQYTFKLRFISGNGNLQTEGNPMAESNEVTVRTRAGVKPATPVNVKFEGKDGGCTVSWDQAEHATHYQILRADSMFAEYEPVKTVSAKTTSVDLTYENQDKYKNYYRVVALNNGQGGDDDFSEAERSEQSEFVSLEKEMFGEHTLIFAETDDKEKVDELLKNIFDQQNDFEADAQFKGEQYQVYFKPGDYTETSCMYLGFYTSFNGLGQTPYDVKLNNIAIPAYLPAGALGGDGNNATCNFWRSAENLSVINTGNEQGKAGFGSWRAEHFNWAVAQAAPLRRVYSSRPVSYDWNYGWASGGYVADCKFDGSFEDNGNKLSAGTFSGQQFYTRNSEITGNAFGTTLNNFYQGVKAPNLPKADGTSGEALLKDNGASNWGIPAADGGHQVFTNIEKTPKLSEKPFLYLDDKGEYQVFVPAMKENTSGTSWSEDNMGEGKNVPLTDFYIAKPTDTAKTINEKIASGKNIYFTPGTYHAEEPIKVNRKNTILLGTGMASIIPDNGETAMEIADVDGVKVAGLIFDAGKNSKYLLKVGEKGTHNDHSSNPVVLQDLFFRIGGTTDSLTTADYALEINSDDVIGDHFWIWRADHGAGVSWDGNAAQNGLTVNGDDVTCYALFNEHFEKNDTLWNGENGVTYFYQNEKCYDPVSQDAWMSHNGTVNGYAAYKVSNDVKKHYAVGLGIYNVFIYTGPEYDSTKVQIQMDNGIEVPNSEDVLIENACIQTFADENKALQKFNHIINGVGDGVSSGVDKETGELGEGWSRKFLLSYQNGTAVVGKNTEWKPGVTGFEPRPGGTSPKDWERDDRGKFLGVETIQNVKAPEDEKPKPEKPEPEEPKPVDPKPEVNPYDDWKKTALTAPAKGQLVPAGPISVNWAALEGADATAYEVWLDGKLADTIEASEAKTLSAELYTTEVAAHTLQVKAVLKNGDKVQSNVRTFYVSKKGISVDNKEVSYPIQNMGESWYYNWSVNPYEQYTGTGEFVPMVWNANDESLAWLKTAAGEGYKVVLGFNEPDLAGQANMTVEEAAAYEKNFTDSGLRVGAPVTAGWASASEWMEDYMKTAGESADFIPMHLYLGYPGEEQVKGVLDEIQKTYEKYQKPIWITEIAFASSDPNWTGLDAVNEEYVNKTKEAMKMLIDGVDGKFEGLDAMDQVERYTWFSFDTKHTYGGVSSLYETNNRGTLELGELTELGELYRSLGNPEGYVLPELDGTIDDTRLPEDTYVKDELTGTEKPGENGNTGTTGKPGADGKPGGTDKTGAHTAKTGDEAKTGMYLLILFGAAAVCVGAVIRRKKHVR